MRTLLLASILVTGCVATATRRPTLVRPKSCDRVALWNTAISVLQDEGYVLQELNESAGFVQTRMAATGIVNSGCLTIPSFEMGADS